MGLADYWINPQNNFSGVDIANNSNSLFNMSNYAQPLFGSNLIGGLGNMFSEVTDFVGNQNSQDWKNYANIGKGLGGIGLGYLNYKQNKNIADQQAQAMNYALYQQKDADKRREENTLNMQTGFNNSGLGANLIAQ